MRNTLYKIVKALLLPIALYTVLLIFAPTRMGSLDSLNIILLQSIVPTIVGYGMSFGYIAGIIDFTIGSRIIFAGLVGGLMSQQFGLPGLIIGCMVTSIILGAVTGGVYWITRIPSLVVSFGLVMIYEILGADLVGGGGMITLSSNMTVLGNAPYSIIIMIATFGLFYLCFYYTRFSSHTRVVGSNELIGKNVGIKPMLVKFNTYVVGGIFLGIASIMQFSYSGSMAAQVNVASMMAVFRPMIGLVIGLTLLPVCKLPVGIFIGTLSLNIIFTGIIALGLPDNLQNVSLGVFLLIVVAIASKKDDFQQLLKRKKTNRLALVKQA